MRDRRVSGGFLRGVLIAAIAVLLALPAAAAARTETINSFDGTEIKVNFFPTDGASAASPAPTVLMGPGWSSPGATDPQGAGDPGVGAPGVGALRAAGFNVLTWDPRGFGDSGGTVEVDSPKFEARDVKALVSFAARQPEALLDSKGDPRVGMAGVSYGGGIQFSAAAIDPRIDAIVPTIAWHSLLTALDKRQTFKAGWGSILYALGKANGTLDPHIDSAFQEGSSTGKISAANRRWFKDRGPGALVKRVTVPTLLVQGTVDTLFTLHEAITNYRILSRDGVPVKMLWFCGGHGACFTNPGNQDRVQNATIAWLERWLMDKRVSTGPGFDWINQNGTRFSAPAYPPPRRKPIRAVGEGSLPITEAGGSGPSGPGPGPTGAISGITNATPATNAVEIPVHGAKRVRQLVGGPRLQMSYSGTASDTNVRVFAQLVDDKTGLVLGNQVTPVRLDLDGQSHEVDQRLEAIAFTLRPDSSVTLQITASASNYGTQRATGTVDLKGVKLTLPVVHATGRSGS